MRNYRHDWHFPLHSKVAIIFIIFIASVLIYQCSPALYMPVSADAERSGTTLDTLLKGRAMYVKNCNSCHNLRPPERFTAAEWEKNLKEMQQKAKISSDEKEFILKYLTSRCRK